MLLYYFRESCLRREAGFAVRYQKLRSMYPSNHPLVALSYQFLRGFTGMRALLICPEFPLSFWSFRKSCQLRGNRTVTPPLGLLTLAALLPPEWELRLADLNARKLTEQDWQWADLILISAMY